MTPNHHNDGRDAVCPQGEKKLAVMVVAQCMEALSAKPPARAVEPVAGKERAAYRREWEAWARSREREIRFLVGNRSARWFEMAGMDKDVVVSDLRARGLLYPTARALPAHVTMRHTVTLEWQSAAKEAG